jgi:glutamate dehydrogenase/leucine dehydrogenase
MEISVPVRINHHFITQVDLTVVIDEILLSSDKTVAVIDGSGVLADPAGLNRQELIRLAKARQMISNFDKSKLGPDGYVVLVEDQDVTLPCESSDHIHGKECFNNLCCSRPSHSRRHGFQE